jgi:hypothetical protein
MSVQYPSGWCVLGAPQFRLELLLTLGELADPRQTERWRNPDPAGPVIGIDQTIHFLFDDHDFDAGEIGWSLFDEAELTAVSRVIDEIEAILVTNRNAKDAYFLDHTRWPAVEQAAKAALDQLQAKGLPWWSDEDE